MSTVAGRRTAAVLAAACLVAGGGAATASTGKITYSCNLPVLGAKPFGITSDSTAPAKLYFGTSRTPTLVTVAQVPPDMVALIAGQLKADSVDGTFVSHITINGAAADVTQKVVKRSLSAGSSSPTPVTAKGPLPKIAATGPGSVTYLPGDITMHLNFTKNGAAVSGSPFDFTCTMPKNDKSIDKVVFAKSPTKVTPTLTYAKASKKETVVAKVVAASGLEATGKITAVLYKGKTKLKSVSATLSKGKAGATFSGISKGSYKLVVTYGGSGALNSSTATKAFTIR